AGCRDGKAGDRQDVAVRAVRGPAKTADAHAVDSADRSPGGPDLLRGQHSVHGIATDIDRDPHRSAPSFPAVARRLRIPNGSAAGACRWRGLRRSAPQSIRRAGRRKPCIATGDKLPTERFVGGRYQPFVKNSSTMAGPRVPGPGLTE